MNTDIEEPITSPETPYSKHYMHPNQSVLLVSVLQDYEARLRVIDRSQSYIIGKVESNKDSMDLVWAERRALQDETVEKIAKFIESLNNHDSDRPSQSNINLHIRPDRSDSMLPTTLFRKTLHITLVISAILGGIFTALKESGVIK